MAWGRFTLAGRSPFTMEHRTVDTGRPAPMPDMTEDDLVQFEAFSEKAAKSARNWQLFALAFLAAAVVVPIIGLV